MKSDATCPASTRSDRLLEIRDGCEVEYSPGQEAYVNAVIEAHLKTAPQLPKPATLPPRPLSAWACIDGKDALLKDINRHLGMDKPTSSQVAVFDIFAAHYACMETTVKATVVPALLFKGGRYTLWDKTELKQRLQKEEIIENFIISPKDGAPSLDLKWSSQMEGQAEKTELDSMVQNTSSTHSINYETEKDGIIKYRATVLLPKGGKIPQTSHHIEKQVLLRDRVQKALAATSPVAVPFSPSDKKGAPLSPAEAAATALENRSRLLALGKGSESLLPILNQELQALLHECIEVGLVEQYLGSKDRRWFCDGVTNYVTWQIVREKEGDAMAKACYNLDAALSRARQFQSQVKLSEWPAVENQSEAEQKTDLNMARYAFATRAVAIMHEQGGPDILPKLLTELGKTPRKKASMKTVAKIYKKMTGHSLEEVLSEAQSRPIPEVSDKAAKSGT